MALLSVLYQDTGRHVPHSNPRSKGLVQMARHSETQARYLQCQAFFPTLVRVSVKILVMLSNEAIVGTHPVWEDEGIQRSTALSGRYLSNSLERRIKTRTAVEMKETRCGSHTSEGNPYNMPSQSRLCNVRSGMKQARQTRGDKNNTRKGHVGGATREFAREEYVSYREFLLA
jgi:hypothetical protein